jgi:hypothetical protein
LKANHLNSRFHILAEARFADLKPVLAERLAQAAASLTPQNFGSLLDPLASEVLQRGFGEAGAQEGTLWLLDDTAQHLVPAYNTGPNAHKLVGQFRQPLDAGLICMVFATEQPFVENEVYKNSLQSKLLDASLGVSTQALIAVPLYLLRECRGVVSCVQLQGEAAAHGTPPGFGPAALSAVQRAASILTRLLEYRLLSSVVDWAQD